MPKTAKTVHIERDTIAQIEALASHEERTFSAMADKLLRDGIETRSAKTTKPATN